MVLTAIGILVFGGLIVGQMLTRDWEFFSNPATVVPFILFLGVGFAIAATFNVVVPGRRMRALRDANPSETVFSIRRDAGLRKQLKRIDADARIVTPNQILGARAGVVANAEGLSLYGGSVPPRFELTIPWSRIEAIETGETIHGVFVYPSILVTLKATRDEDEDDDMLDLAVSNEQSFAGVGIHDGEVVDPLVDALRRLKERAG